jgi:STE24 endopeptidase
MGMNKTVLLFVLALFSVLAIRIVPGISKDVAADPQKQTIRSVDDVQLYPSEEARRKVKSYTHGSYALDIFNTFYFFLLMGWLAFTGKSAKLRDFCRRISRNQFLVIFLFWLFFFSIVSLFTFPVDLYKQFLREHAYGFSNQSFSSWFGDYGKELLISLIVGGLFFELIYWVITKSPKNWWIWGCTVCILFVILGTAITPELIAPLFNKYEPVKDAQLRSRVLALARSHGINPKDVYQVDFSRQSNKIGAFVFGLLGTERIVLTDTLIQRCSPEEILVVVGHEMGHYVLKHIWKGVLFFAVTIFLFGYLFQLAFRRIVQKNESRLGFREISDVASLPLLLLVFAILFFLFSPILNLYSRHQEAEADWYGLVSTGYWQAEIDVDKKLGEYREMDPNPIIEFLFFDHPSGKNRIRMALDYRDRFDH